MAIKMRVRRKGNSTRPAADMKRSRRAVELNVMISIVVAVGLLVVVNVIGDMVTSKHNLRWSLETRGRYALSETAKRILDRASEPIRLTSVYTSTDPQRKPEQYLPRLRDLMEEMHQWKADVTAMNVTSDRGKAELVARLRERLDADAEKHRKLIEHFQLLAQAQEGLFQQELQKWQAFPAASWLGGFGLPKAFETDLSDSQEALKKLSALIRQELSGSGLPNYPEMAKQIKDVLGEVRKRLEDFRTSLLELAKLPAEAQKAQKELNESAQTVTGELRKAAEAAGKPDAPAPADPAKVLAEVARAARAAFEPAAKVVRGLVALDNQAGNQLQNLPSWQQAAVHLSQVAEQSRSLAEQLKDVSEAVKVETQKKVITEQLRPVLAVMLARAQSAEGVLKGMLEQLAEPDQATSGAFTQAQREDYLQAQRKPIEDLLAEAGQLGELADQGELIDQISQDNFVLVEIGKKVGVASFNDVWPLAPRNEFAPPAADEEDKDRRVFYGDMAICAKVLSLTAEPFAEVVLTFFEEPMPPQMMGRQPPLTGPIPSMYLQVLRDRLKAANLEVKDWNLSEGSDAGPPQPPPPTNGRKQVLLVLPPPEAPPPMMGPQQMPSFGPQQVQAVRDAIARGTPAIFLTGYFRPRYWGQTTPEFGWGSYLREDWGLDVKTGLRLVMGQRDPLEPDKFVLPVLRWDFLPLSTFTDDSPVGRPLRARRFYWLSACPIEKVKDSQAGATVQDILVVPKEMSNLWATAQAEDLWEKIVSGRGTGVTPDPQAGDVKPPLSLAVEAQKTIGQAEGRVIVLGVGLSYIDGFLTYRIPQLRSGDVLAAEPPPTADTDLVVNSVYHLAGRGDYIGAGPALVQPIELIRPATMATVQIVFGFVWPGLMLLAGAVVMLVRRR